MASGCAWTQGALVANRRKPVLCARPAHTLNTLLSLFTPDRFLASLDMSPASPSLPAPTAAPAAASAAPTAASSGGDEERGHSDAASEATRAAVVGVCMAMHIGVRKLSQDFFKEQGRPTYTTPTSYLELIQVGC